MRRVAHSIILLVATSAVAQGQSRVPGGCFVTDAERAGYYSPPRCFNEERAAYIPFSQDDGYSAEDILSIYGFQYGVHINIARDFYYKWQDAEGRAQANQSSSDVHYGWYVAEFNRGRQLKALEAKLRKACGSRCRSIKTIQSLSSESTEAAHEMVVVQKSAGASATFEQYMSRGQ